MMQIIWYCGLFFWSRLNWLSISRCLDQSSQSHVLYEQKYLFLHYHHVKIAIFCKLSLANFLKCLYLLSFETELISITGEGRKIINDHIMTKRIRIRQFNYFYLKERLLFKLNHAQSNYSLLKGSILSSLVN